MSLKPQQQQRERDVEGDVPPDSISLEEMPLNRDTGGEQAEDRRRMRLIFDKYDSDGDGLISTPELKALIASAGCRDMPAHMAEQIMQRSDEDHDGCLDFEEFYAMSLRNRWIMRRLVARYCRYVVPSPKRQPVDEVDGEYERQMSLCPPPLTMIIFSIIEIIAFLVDVIHFQDDPDYEGNIGESVNGPAATLCIYNPYKRYEAWRFASYMFVHVGPRHLVMNLIFQIFLGIALELVHQWWRVALVYLAGVLAGSMGTSLSSPRTFLAGASGGVYALITAHVATIIMNYSEMEYAIVQLFIFLVVIFVDLGGSVYHHLTDEYDRIGYVAHLSGAVAGLLVGIGVLRNLEKRPWEKVLWWTAVIVYFALMTTGIMVHIFLPEYFPKPKYN